MAKYGIREICDVVFKAKKKVTIGNTDFEKGAPVIYFDTLKTSSLEGAATTVYATGGKGNPRLVAWDGERTLTFNMEDALISPMGLAILTGAGLVNPTTNAPVITHKTERVKVETDGEVKLAKTPSANKKAQIFYGLVDENGDLPVSLTKYPVGEDETVTNILEITTATKDAVVFVDYYVDETGATNGVTQVDIEPGKFSGSFYIEGSTLWRDTDGADHPVEIVIPNGKVQSNFTFTMANSGDPSTFNFVVDALADYTEFDQTKKVLAAMQIMEETI